MTDPEVIKVLLGDSSPILNECALGLTVICKDLEHPEEILVTKWEWLGCGIIQLIRESIPHMIIKSK